MKNLLGKRSGDRDLDVAREIAVPKCRNFVGDMICWISKNVYIYIYIFFYLNIPLAKKEEKTAVNL